MPDTTNPTSSTWPGSSTTGPPFGPFALKCSEPSLSDLISSANGVT